jgi:hypothetical protein
MVEFLESGNTEWLRQGGHPQVMTDKTFLSFEAECMYDRMRTEANGTFENSLCNGTFASSPAQSSALVEQSMKHQRVAASVDSNMPAPMVFSQNESQETFAQNNYGSLGHNSINEDDLEEKAIPMSALVSGMQSGCSPIHPMAFSQEAPLAIGCGSNTSMLKGNIVVGQGLIAGVKKPEKRAASRGNNLHAQESRYNGSPSNGSPLGEMPLQSAALKNLHSLPASSDNGNS